MCARTNTQAHKRARTHTHIHTHAHTCAHTLTHTHIRMHANVVRVMGFANFTASLAPSLVFGHLCNSVHLIHAHWLNVASEANLRETRVCVMEVSWLS